MGSREPLRLGQASNRSIAAGMAAFRAHHTTPADTVARVSCKEGANMLVLIWLFPDDFNG
jgi:hypothetical protein